VCVCVCLCGCVCVDLWAFFFVYFMAGILAIVAKMVQDLAELPCLQKRGVEEEVKEEVQPPSVQQGAFVQAQPDFAFGGPQTAFEVPGWGKQQQQSQFQAQNGQFSQFA
jgi:hypothetical protein